MKVKNCVICDSPFEITGKGTGRQVTCSLSCRKVNQSNLKKESRMRLKESKDTFIKGLSEEWKLPIYIILQYGVEFLKENEVVREALVISNKISGKFDHLTEEEIAMRRKATVRQANQKQRLKRGYSVSNCEICSTEFTKEGSSRGNNRVTCSDKCSDELHKQQASKSQKRRNERLKIERSKKVFADISLKCQCCGSDYHPSKYNINKSRFCEVCKVKYGQKLYKKLELIKK